MVTTEAISVPARAPAINATAAIQLGAVLVAFATFLFAPQVLNDGDTFWHLTAGRWMIEHGQVLRQDVFSSTVPGRDWVTLEWLSEVAMGAAFNLGGWTGLLMLYGLAAAAAAALLARRLGQSLGGLSLVIALVLAFGCASPSLLARPHMLAAPLLALWMVELLAARDQDRAPRLWLAVAMAAWANLHGSYVLGLALFGVFGLEALWLSPGRRLEVVRTWALPGVLTLAAVFATPHGFAAVTHPVYLVSQSAVGEIAEWLPMDFSRVQPFELALLTILFVGLSRGVKVPPLRLLLALAVIHLALQHQRHQLVAALIVPMLLAPSFAEALGPQAPAQARRGFSLLAFAAASIVLLAVRLAIPPRLADAATRPVTALDHAPPALLAQPVLNSYGFGGYLMHRGARPFIDGRADMYGDPFVMSFQRIMRGDRRAAEAALAHHRIAWTLLAPGEPLVAVMDSEPGWRRLYNDRYAVIHVRAP